VSMSRFLLSHPEKAGGIRRAVGSRCEICGSPGEEDSLEVHCFCDPDQESRLAPGELEEFLLVLCSRCHESLHSAGATLRDQQLLARGREREVSERIRKILSFVPKAYDPPESDVEGAYRDACASKYGNLV